jgi:hypothetical protein
MLMLTSVLVMCRLTGQYVHPSPTRWDRVFNRDYCTHADREVCDACCVLRAARCVLRAVRCAMCGPAKRHYLATRVTRHQLSTPLTHNARTHPTGCGRGAV